MKSITLRHPTTLKGHNIGEAGGDNFCDGWYIIGMGGFPDYGVIIVARKEPEPTIKPEEVAEVLESLAEVQNQFLSFVRVV